MAIKAISVSQLNNYIGRVLSTEPLLSNVSVMGEIANLTKHSSGHWYFSLKDENSTVRCFLARDRVRSLRYDLEDGMKITAHSYVSVYERGGSYSLNIREIDVEGEGDLKKAFEILKARLEKEGLFDTSYKKELPAFPKKIGVVTSPTGAAIHDIITTIKRRNPLVSIILYPCLVQGQGAAETIALGINSLNAKSLGLDLLIVGRGGGSAEDLWSFNEEIVARAIFESKLPVISAVGHEVDFTIADFVADLRAATPTAAAELAAPDIEYYKDILNICSPNRMYRALSDNIDFETRHVKHLMESCNYQIGAIFEKAEHRLEILKQTAESFNPYMQLEKGYSIVKNEKNKWIASADAVKADDKLKIIFKDGELECLVLNKQLKN